MHLQNKVVFSLYTKYRLDYKYLLTIYYILYRNRRRMDIKMKRVMKLISMMLYVVIVVGCTTIPGTIKNVNDNDKVNESNSQSINEIKISEHIEVDSILREIVEEVEVNEVVILTNEEVAQAVIRGEYGNGTDRVVKIESMGYNYDEIQMIVNKLVSQNIEKPEEYKSNTVYIKNTSMPFIISNFDNQARDIDGTSRTWVTTGYYPNWSPDDNHGTFFAQHNNRGGDVLMKLDYGDVIIVTDSYGTPYKYVVDKIIRNNMVTDFDDELGGGLDKEYIVFQTCEYGEGNIHVFATRQYE